MRNVLNLYEKCMLCPKACGVDRKNGQKGLCRMPSEVVAASAVLHMGEEPLLTGEKGSGTVFFSGCTLGCSFCQNVQISCDNTGTTLDNSELAEIFLRLQKQGAANINLVTATQFVPSILTALSEARANGLDLPVMWNSSGWETPKTVRLLAETVDIWLPDIKTLDSAVAARLFNEPGYPKAAMTSVKVMAEQLRRRGGMLVEDDVMKRGMIVRHLVMPGNLESSRGVFEWFARHLKDDAMLSVMVQYTPVNSAGEKIASKDYVMPGEEYEQLVQWLEDYEIEDGFIQEPEAASQEWIPDFNRDNPFPSNYSRPVWHWRNGYLC